MPNARAAKPGRLIIVELLCMMDIYADTAATRSPAKVFVLRLFAFSAPTDTLGFDSTSACSISIPKTRLRLTFKLSAMRDNLSNCDSVSRTDVTAVCMLPPAIFLEQNICAVHCLHCITNHAIFIFFKVAAIRSQISVLAKNRSYLLSTIPHDTLTVPSP